MNPNREEGMVFPRSSVYPAPEMGVRALVSEPEPTSRGAAVVMTIFCTTCGAAKDHAERPLPASQRYQSARIRRVHAAARTLGVGFAILSGKYGLLKPDDGIPDYDHLLQPAEVSAHAARVARQLREMNVEKVIFFTGSLAADRNLQPYLDCMASAAETAGVEVALVEIPADDEE
jgi:hypothetical protein